MRMLALLLSLLMSVSPAWATWTFKQKKCTGTATSQGCTSGNTCTISGLTAITAGSTVVGVLLNDGNSEGLSSINGETWTTCVNCLKVNGTSQAVDARYVLSATGGETSFIFTITNPISGGLNVCVYEAKSDTTVAFDAALSALIASGVPTTSTLTLTGTNDFLVAAQVWSLSLTGVTAPYADFVESNGNGTADKLNTSSGNGAAFTPTTAGSGPGFTIAIKETGAGTSGGAGVGGKGGFGGTAGFGGL